MLSANLICLALLGGGVAGLAFAEGTEAPGIPIADQLTINKCGGCHQRDSNGMMRRLSYIRATPEIWEESIKRMVRLHGLSIQPAEAHEIVKFLNKNNGLAPEEARPVFWEVEHRMFRDQSDKIPDDALQHTCNYCHTIGRVLSQRRTREDYEKLISMHLGLFPGAENTLRPRRKSIRHEEEMPVSLSAPTGQNPFVVPVSPEVYARTDGKYPSDVAVDYLAKAQPLLTPEWIAWKAVMRTPKLEGKWLLTGYEHGKGRVFGTVTIAPGTSPDEFVTQTDIEYATSGVTLSRTGKGVVYTGYSWRGRSTGANTSQSADPSHRPCC
jgi:quinohemoprotein amine dehydrogenase